MLIENARCVLIGADGDGIADDREGNIIAYNNSVGISVIGDASQGNSIRGNSIYSNGGLGIDLADDGVTMNDPADADLGPHGLSNFPVLEAVQAGEQPWIYGSYDRPARMRPLRWISMPARIWTRRGSAKASVWIGSADIATDAEGQAPFAVQLPVSVAAGQYVSATATGLDGTSEFSGAFVATGISTDSILIAGGGWFADVMQFTPGSVVVTINGHPVGHYEQALHLVQVQGLAGDDQIIIDQAIGVPAQVFGGEGDDFIQGGSGDDVLDGGAGADVIRGVAGDDTIAGGDDQDWVDGQQGRDQVQVEADDTVRVDAADALSGITVRLASPVSLDDSTAVRGQPLVFESAIPADGSTVTWQFGDGFVAEGVTVTHAITAPGLYTVTTVVIGPAGSRTTLTRDLLIAAVAMQRDPNDSAKTALAVGGTVGNDRIRITPRGNQGSLDVKLEGVSLGSYSPNGSIMVYGQAGDDDMELAASIKLAAWLFGGEGNDRLTGGNGSSVLLGGPGDDLLMGGSGRDLLVGGTGRDRLIGHAGEDLLIGGTLRVDRVDANLAAIMAEWTSDRSYDERVANLRRDARARVSNDGPTAQCF